MGLRKDIACADIEQKSRKKTEIKNQESRGQLEKKSGQHAKHRRQRVKKEKNLCSFETILVRKHHRDRIHSVREIMRHNRYCDKQADRGTRLETEPDAEPVQEAVPDERESRQNSDLRMDMLGIVALVSVMNENCLLKNMKNQKTGKQRNHHSRWRDISLFYLLDDFGKDFKKNHAQNDSGREPHDEMQLVFQLYCQKPSGIGGNKSCD